MLFVLALFLEYSKHIIGLQSSQSFSCIIPISLPLRLLRYEHLLATTARQLTYQLKLSCAHFLKHYAIIQGHLRILKCCFTMYAHTVSMCRYNFLCIITAVTNLSLMLSCGWGSYLAYFAVLLSNLSHLKK